MKTNIFIVVLTITLLASCTPGVPAQETKAGQESATATSTASATSTPARTATLALPATMTPTVTPSTPVSCPKLLSPLDAVQLPAMGKVIFSWAPVDQATLYVLKITLPSGYVVSFETKETSRGQYMEAFPAAGDYRWNVTAFSQGRKRIEICSSTVATFSKPVYNGPVQPTEVRKK